MEFKAQILKDGLPQPTGEGRAFGCHFQSAGGGSVASQNGGRKSHGTEKEEWRIGNWRLGRPF
jgi:hypothetical protein